MNKIYLRALNLQDIDRTYAWHNDADLYVATVGAFRYVSHQAEEEWLRHKTTFSDKEVNLAICLVETKDHIGNIYIRDIDWIARHAELTGVIIGDPANRSKGYGISALRLLVKYTFQDLGLIRLYGLALAEHGQSINMMKKCGFTIEGTLRKHSFKKSVFKDVVIMGVCIEDVSMEDWYTS